MTEHQHTDAQDSDAQDSDAQNADAPDSEADLTGHPVVDEVLETMRGLQDRPVEEHVTIFEAAHEKLRAALTDAGDRADRAGS